MCTPTHRPGPAFHSRARTAHLVDPACGSGGFFGASRARLKAHLVDHADQRYPRWFVGLAFNIFRLRSL